MTTNITSNVTGSNTGQTALRENSGADLVRQSLVVLATVATIFVNYLATALPINGLDTGEISDSFQVLFVPAGYVFSIWGLIYLGLIGYSVYQALPGQRENPRLRAIAPYYLVSAAANIGWIFLWHYQQFVLTIPVMLILLGSLVQIYRNKAAYMGSAGHGVTGSITSGERWLVSLPFSVYLGWITVATVANVTTTLESLNWGGLGLGDSLWFWSILAVATLIGAGFAWLRRDVAYVAVLVWAFAGIAVKHSAITGVAVASIAAAVLLIVIVAAGLWVRGKEQTL